MKIRKKISTRSLLQSRLTKLKIILALLGFMFVSFFAVMIWATYFIVNKNLKSAQLIELSTAEIYASRLQNSLPKFYEDLSSDVCQQALNQLMTVETWRVKSPQENFTHLSQSCWKKYLNICEGKSCQYELQYTARDI